MKHPLVSIIVPCYNQAQYLSEALESVLQQTYTDWECIIVNDGSPDNTDIIVKDWLQRDNRFKYLYKDNGGLSSARNFGIENSNGTYILLLDADDKYHHTFIEKGVKVLIEDISCGVVTSWGQRFVGNNLLDVFKLSGKKHNDFLFKNAAIGTALILSLIHI